MKKSCALLWLLYEVLVFKIILHTIRMLICIIKAILPTPISIAMQGKEGLLHLTKQNAGIKFSNV